jgi:hypothetical protein
VLLHVDLCLLSHATLLQPWRKPENVVALEGIGGRETWGLEGRNVGIGGEKGARRPGLVECGEASRVSLGVSLLYDAVKKIE